jgi:hypothetical protein
MSENLARMSLRVEASDDADAQEIDDLAAELRERLLELDVESVDAARAGEAPPGTRAGDAFAIGGLIVSLVASPELLKGAIGTIQSWLAARSGKTVELELGGDKIKLTGLTSDQQQRFIELYLERHTKK